MRRNALFTALGLAFACAPFALGDAAANVIYSASFNGTAANGWSLSTTDSTPNGAAITLNHADATATGGFHASAVDEGFTSNQTNRIANIQQLLTTATWQASTATEIEQRGWVFETRLRVNKAGGSTNGTDILRPFLGFGVRGEAGIGKSVWVELHARHSNATPTSGFQWGLPGGNDTGTSNRFGSHTIVDPVAWNLAENRGLTANVNAPDNNANAVTADGLWHTFRIEKYKNDLDQTVVTFYFDGEAIQTRLYSQFADDGGAMNTQAPEVIQGFATGTPNTVDVDIDYINFTIYDTLAIPEPSSLALLGMMGLCGLGVVRRRKSA